MNWKKIKGLIEGEEYIFWFPEIRHAMIAKYDYKIEALGATHCADIVPPEEECCGGNCFYCEPL